MAEALLKHTAGEDFRAFSPGTEPKGEIAPFAMDFLKEHRVWHQSLRSESYREFLLPDAPPMNFVVSVGTQPPAGLQAAWPGQPKVIHWRITEPVVEGSLAEKANSFRKTFTEIETRIRLFVRRVLKVPTFPGFRRRRAATLAGHAGTPPLYQRCRPS
jgi:arsenate reductase